MWWKPQRELALAALTQVPVMVTAETGNQRLAYARFIHDTSARQPRPFIAVSCSATASRGEGWHSDSSASLNGGAEGFRSLFLSAAGGTLFLDDIESMSDSLQEQLCSALCYPLETTRDPHEVRVITGARPAWPTASERQRFSDRLYYRLNVMRVDCPDLPLDWTLTTVQGLETVPFESPDELQPLQRLRGGPRAARER